MILLSHPTGNQNVREALAAFDDAGLLAEFWTTLSWNPDGLVHRFLPRSLQDLLGRRSYRKTLRDRTHTLPLREMGRLLGNLFTMDAVSAGLDSKVSQRIRQAQKPFKFIYAYEDSALKTFEAAEQKGISRVYDLPIGYWRAGQQIFAEEKEREPEWAITLTGIRDSADKLARKDAELQLANRIVVASSFTRRTLESSPAKARIDIIPYGAPSAISSHIVRPHPRLRVLFVGSLGQRKGLSYLIKACELMKNTVELTLLGRKAAADCRPLNAATQQHRWVPTLDHAGVLREMHQHDVLVFPSLFEGFGLVVLESMAQATPVITTENTCGPDVIEDGVDGFIVPTRSAEAIAEKLDALAADPERLMAMKAAARRKAELHPWAIYRRRLVEMAQDVIAA